MLTIFSSFDPKSSRTKIFALALANTRELPTKTDDITYETIHPSVLEHEQVSDHLLERVRKNPSLVCSLLPFEEEMKRDWPYVPGKNPPRDSRASAQVVSTTTVESTVLWNTTREMFSVGSELGTEIFKEVIFKLRRA